MRIRRTLVAALAGLLFAGAGHAQPATEGGPDEAAARPVVPVTVDRLSAYLNSLTTVWARFTQINSDTSISRGTLVVKRPWRARLEYDPPDTGLVVASARRIAFFDRKSNRGPDIFPLSRTPLYLLLKDSIDLADRRLKPRFVTGAEFSELHLRSPTKSYDGMLILSFSNDPVQLDGWTYIDEFGNRTHVLLDSLGTGIEPGEAMFDIDHEVRQQERNR